MVLAGEQLFVAGPPDTVDPKDPMATFEGRKGGSVLVLSAADGQRPARSQNSMCPTSTANVDTIRPRQRNHYRPLGPELRLAS